VTEGIPVIRGQNMARGRWVTGEFAFVTAEKADQLSANIARPGDLVFTQRGTVGQVALVPHGSFDRYLLSQSQMKLSADGTRADALFLYYLFTAPEQQNYIHQNVIQTGVPHTNLALLRNTPIHLPPLSEQRRIASILGALDAKIELNRQMNETLEAIARAVFKSWFVDFDPVRAKMEGRQPFGMDAATAALFPSSFQNSLLGRIPKGWRASTIGEEFCITMGQSPPGETYNQRGEGVLFFQGRTDFGFRFPTPRVFCAAPTRFAQPGDALISVRAPIGDLNMAAERCCIGRGLAALTHKSESRSYCYYAIKSLHEAFLGFEGSGTVFGCMSKAQLTGLGCLAPDPRALSAFEAVAAPLDDRIAANHRESGTLALLRDALLPNLISGKIRLKDAEKQAEAML
jgi:type I restriction enzyme S subunit